MTQCRTPIVLSPVQPETRKMMSRKKGPDTIVWGLRILKTWRKELDEAVAESEGKWTDKTELVRDLIGEFLEKRRGRKGRQKR